jgi:hypothetical protein
MPQPAEHYILATGGKDTERLRLLGSGQCGRD